MAARVPFLCLLSPPNFGLHGSTHLAAKGPEHPHDANLRVSIRDTEFRERWGVGLRTKKRDQ